MSNGKENAVLYTIKYILFVIVLAATVFTLYFFFMLGLRAGDPSPVSTETNGTVILDAGHGGMDGGAISGSGVAEKVFNLEITLILRDFLEASGVDVILTRDSDVMLESGGKGNKKTQDLRARTEIAKSNPDALFVSIHMNKFPQSSVHGITMYYSPNNPGSKRIADSMASSVKEYLQPDNTRPIKAADSKIYVLDRIMNPAVLIECGFLSNADEERLLLNDGYRHKLAMVFGVTLLDCLAWDD